MCKFGIKLVGIGRFEKLSHDEVTVPCEVEVVTHGFVVMLFDVMQAALSHVEYDAAISVTSSGFVVVVGSRGVTATTLKIASLPNFSISSLAVYSMLYSGMLMKLISMFVDD